MKPAAVLALLAFCLSGCAAQRAAQDDATCQSYGAVPGSDAYVQCRMAQDTRRDQRRAHVGQMLSQPSPPAYRCTKVGDATTCTPQ